MKSIQDMLRSFQVRLTAAIVVSMLLVLMLSHVLIYKYSYNAQFDGLRDRLKTIAQSAALLVDPTVLQRVPLKPEGINTGAFQEIQQKLQQFQSISEEIDSVYTMTKTAQPGIWQFIVDAEPLSEEDMRLGLHSFPGKEYDASRFSEMLKAFDEPSVDLELEVDEWGATLSGYAPIRDASGRAIAMIGVDMAADDVYALEQGIQHRVLLVFLLGIVLSLLIGMVVSHRVTDPIARLVKGTRHVADGDYEYRVQVEGDDELAELADAFNEMSKSIDSSRKRLLNYFYSAAQSLVRVLEARDEYTEGHSEAVADYCVEVALRMGYSKETVELFRVIAVLHDIGKVGIRDQILHKPGPLNDEEFAEIRKHTVIGENILKPILSDNEKMLEVVRHHHERYDGKGYPDRLDADEINIFAAIVCVCDAYHAMTSDRVYRKSLTREQAIQELKDNSGTQFHPKVVEVFLQVIES